MRETIFAAFYQLLQSVQISNVNPFTIISRKFQLWDAGTFQQPALFIREGNQRVQTSMVGLSRTEYDALVFIYTQVSPDGGTIPNSAVNELVQAVLDVIQPQPGLPQTLGGLVTNCAVSGDILVYDGCLPADTQCIAMIPVVLTTGQ